MYKEIRTEFSLYVRKTVRNFRNYLTFKLYCGAGGNRTLVQSSSPKAFYMLSFHLIFEKRSGGKHPNRILSL